jgi:hypothetical protein
MGSCCSSEKMETTTLAAEESNLIIDTEKLQELTSGKIQIKKCCQSKHKDDKKDTDEDDEKSCGGDYCKCCGKIAKTMSFNTAKIPSFFSPIAASDNCFLYHLLIDNLDSKGIFHPPIAA